MPQHRNMMTRVGFLILGVLLFILSIQTLNTSTKRLLPALQPWFTFTTSPLRSLGFGWLAAYIILSGSPIAALALSFFDAGLLSSTSAFFMIIGSRLGASFILIAIGLIEYFKNERGFSDSLSVAFLSFLISYSTLFPSLIFGYILLRYNLFTFTVSIPWLTHFLNLYQPLVHTLLHYIGTFFSFPFSLLLVWLSLSTFERAFRKIEIKEAQSAWVNFLMENPAFSLLFGFLVTLAGQSVSLSLGIMIPLYIQGYIQRRNLIPYIMGANIATYTDTLSAALILQNTTAINLVMVAVLSNTLISAVFLLFYQKYYTILEKTMNSLMYTKSALSIFFIFLFTCPLFLIFFGGI